MKAIVIWAFVGVFLLAMASFMVTYTVKFTDAAVLTTFGQAREGEEIKPGLHFKWFSPIQSVTTYDKRLRIVETRLETQQTSDNRPVIMEAYALWRVVDANVFYQRFSNAGERAEQHLSEADRIIDSRMRSGMALVGRYALTELFPPDGGPTALDSLERELLASVRDGGRSTDEDGEMEGSFSGGGIEIVQVGISKILLPEEVTTAVVDRMLESRNRETRELTASGDQEASKITTMADEDSKRILEFARFVAAREKNLGEREAGLFLSTIENPELALFLQNLEFMRRALQTRGTTLVMPLSMPGLRMLDPRVIDQAIRDGELPEIGLGEAPGGEGAVGGVQ